jgi:hypothetical protein
MELDLAKSGLPQEGFERVHRKELERSCIPERVEVLVKASGQSERQIF